MAGRSMSRTASTIGMMEGAFFVSRTDLLAWVNALLQVNLTKVEQCASGAIYCQIIDACHPNTVAMRKVNWMAKADHEFIPNYKVLQAAFDKNYILKHIDVDKLIRAKYQDNLEFLQWMKCYWERERQFFEEYDPLPPRESKPMPPWARSVLAPGAAAPRDDLRRSPAPAAQDKENVRPRAAPRAAEQPDGKKPQPGPGPAGRPAPLSARGAGAGGVGGGGGAGGCRSPRASNPAGTVPASRAAASENAAAEAAAAAAAAREHALRQQVEELQAKAAVQAEENDDLKGTLDVLERERDYYFRKLREVEILCSTLQARMECEQAPPDVELTPFKLVKDIQGILYAAEEGQEEEEEDERVERAEEAEGDILNNRAELVGMPATVAA